MRFRCAVVATLAFSLPLFAQTLHIGTLAGSTSGGGYVDDIGASARFSVPRGIAADSAGNLYVADTSNHVIRRITPDGAVTTLAGLANAPGFADGTGSAARFRYPVGIAVDPTSGTIVVADKDNHVLRRITPNGTVTTFAGAPGVSGTTNGNVSAARFTFPRGLVSDASGTIYVADASNDVIRKITTDGTVSTLAGIMRFEGSGDGFGTQAAFDHPYDIALDSSGNLYVSDNGNSTIRKITPEGRVTTVAGYAGASGDVDGVGSDAYFASPWSIAVDASGTVYVADTGNEKIRRIAPNGTVTTLVGDGFTGANDGIGTQARFNSPSEIAFGPNGTLYVVDAYNFAVRAVDVVAASVTTLAGSKPANGLTNGVGTAARFHFPHGVAVDAAGNAYVAENSCAIRKITPQGVVTTFAGMPGEQGSQDGTGTAARFRFPRGITAGPDGNVYVADTGNHTIRRITPAGVVTTLAGLAGEEGFQNGSGSQARFFSPYGIAADSLGNLYVADTYNHTIRIVEPAGVVTNFAGDGIAGYYDAVGTSADFRYPIGITVDAARNLYIADWGNDVIRKITQSGVVTTLAGNASSSGSVDGTGASAKFDGPWGIASDPNGNLFVVSDDHTVRYVSSAGVVKTAAGLAYTAGNVNGTGSAARFAFPEGVAVSSDGRVLIADLYNHAIRVGTFAAPSIDTFTASPQHLDAPGAVTLTWAVRDATTVTIDQGVGAVPASGFRVVTVSQTATYTLTATGPGGTTTRSVTVFIGGTKRRTSRH